MKGYNVDLLWVSIENKKTIFIVRLFFYTSIPSSRMYKQFTLDELTKVNTGFFDHLHSIYTKKHHVFFKAFLKEMMKEGKRLYFFERNKPLFRIQLLHDGRYRFVDEQEKLELFVNEDGVNQMHNLLKNKGQMKAMQRDNKTILNQLLYEFQQGQWNLVQDKPFVVYDIETTYTGNGIHDQYFEMAYSISSSDDNNDVLQYKYIDRDAMQRYTDYLLDFDGWIVGYNQIGFDNPVMIANLGYSKEQLEILNKKSIDPFLFLYKLLGKRMKLSVVAQALVTSGKTLESWAEWSKLLEQWKNTGDKKALSKVKKYCKNDVQITLGVFLSLIKNKKINIEGKTYEFTIEDIITKWGVWSMIQEEKKGKERLW